MALNFWCATAGVVGRRFDSRTKAPSQKVTFRAYRGTWNEVTQYAAMLDADGGTYFQIVKADERKKTADAWAAGDFSGAEFVKRADRPS